MKSIKKFSAMTNKDQVITESAKVTPEAVEELIKKIGFDSIEELKKEKDLLSKLEALSKSISKKQDISEEDIEEDRAEDIEAEVSAKGTPKSLEGEGKEKEGDEEVIASDAEVAEEYEKDEDRAEDIEDEIVTMGKSKSLEKDKGEVVTKDQEITKEVPAEADEVEDKDGVEVAAEEEETPKATRRIMAFEDFVKEKEMTINKNVKYHDDDEEPEDYAVPVAASADPVAEGYQKMEDDDDDDDEERGEEDERKGDEMEDKGDKKVDSEDDKEKVDHYKGAVKSDDKEIDALKKDVEYDEEEEEDARKDESRIMSFATFVNEAYGMEEEEDEEEMDEEYDRVVLGGNKGDKSKTHSGEDYEKDEEEDEVDEAYGKKEEYEKDEEDMDEGSYEKSEEEEEVDEKYDRVVLGGNKGDKSKTHDGKDYEKDEEEEEKDESVKEYAKKEEYEKDEEDMEEGSHEEDEEVDEKYDRVVLGGNKGDKSKTHDGKDYEKDEEEEEKDESVEEAVGEVITKVEGDEIKDEESGDDGIAIPAIKGDGPETAAGIAGDMMDKGKPKSVEGKGKDLISKDQKITDVVKGEADDKADGTEIVKEEEEVLPDDSIAEKFRKLAEKKFNKVNNVNEKEITNDADFKDYAMAILKDAHGDKFDEAKAMEVVNGLKDKYKDDYGAMVGALQSTMGS